MLVSGPIDRILSALIVSAALAACRSAAVSGEGTPQGQTVVVEVFPSSAELAPGAQLQFTARVTGTADTAVAWEVLTPGGGAIDATGLYTAPSTTGSYEIQGTSKKNPNSHGKGHVVVTPSPTVAVSVTPHDPVVPAGGSLAFSASVTGTADTAVTWLVSEASGCGSVSAAGVYAAPSAAATCHVMATSNADPTKSDTATVTVSPPQPVVVTIAPSSGAANACQSLTFTATVTGALDTAVTWSVQEGAAGGAITSGGVYTAPSAAGTYHVIAASQAAPSSSAIVPVVVTEKVLSVAVSPQVISIPAGGSAQFTATVTTTCGTTTATKVVSAN